MAKQSVKRESTPARMPTGITPRVASIREVCEHADLFNVNPRFQRKDVWGIGEKQALIDTILLGEQPPSLLGYDEIIDGYKRGIAIIDGHQRISTILEFRNDGFKTWSVAQKRRQEPNSEPPVAPKKLYSELSPNEQEVFLSGSIIISRTPQGLSMDEIINRFLRVNNHKSLSYAERLGAYASKANELAEAMEENTFWEEFYDGVTNREQVSQCCLHILTVELTPGAIVDIDRGTVFSLATGKRDAAITESIEASIKARFAAMYHLYHGTHFTTRAIAVLMYQSIVLLEAKGYNITHLQAEHLGRLTPWMQPIISDMKRTTSVPKYGFAATKLLRKEDQRAFWNKHQQTILSLLSVYTKSMELVS